MERSFSRYVENKEWVIPFYNSLPCRFEETRIPIEKVRRPRALLLNKAKRLTNRFTGRQLVINPGVGWKEICEEILCDGTHPKSLAQVAAGKWKTANGWEVEILD